MSCRLSELITQVRACKTAEAERARITEECALIRNAIKEEGSGKRRPRLGGGTSPHRERNMLKLMFAHMMGHSTHWAQMECVTMIASPHFHEKRVGYLGLALLLDESASVLTLVTHQLSRDLQDESPFVASLALSTIANIASADMARDLHRQVGALLSGGMSLTRKKAALTCIRLFKTAPDLIDGFVPRVIGLLTDRTHSTIMTGTTLMWHMARLRPAIIPRFATTVPHLAKLLRKLAVSTSVPNYTIGGVCDPFLQSRLLSLLRVLGRGNAAASEQMNDVLAHVATHTDASRTAGNAILYDAVQCILDVESESGLRVLAVNILGRFLLNKENNIRYVALNTLCNIVDRDLPSVARHRSTIVACLRDPDTSIRRRALDLVYALTDRTNILQMAGEMVNYAVIAEADERPTVCARVASAARRFAPSMRWEADTLLVLIAVRGEAARKEVVRRLIYLVTAAPGENTQASLAHKTLEMLNENLTGPDCQTPLLLVAAWCAGEFAAELTADPPALPEAPAESVIPVGPRGRRRDAAELIATLGSLLTHHKATSDVKGVALTSLAKLLAKLPASALTPEDVDAARGFIGTFSTSLNQELQARSVEFLALTAPEHSEVTGEVMTTIPALTADAVRRLKWQSAAAEAADAHAEDAGRAAEEAMADEDDLIGGPGATDGSAGGSAGGGMVAMGTSGATAADESSAQAAKAVEALDDDGLLDLFGGAASPADSGAGASPADADPVADLFGGAAPASAASASRPAEPPAAPGSAARPSELLDVAGLFAGGSAAATPAVPAAAAVAAPTAAPPRPVETEAFSFGPLRVTLQAEPAPDDATAMTVTMRAYRAPGAPGGPIEPVVLESAVAKYMRQSFSPPSARGIPAGSDGPVSRAVRVVNPQRGAKPFKLMMRVQSSPAGGGDKLVHKADVTRLLPAL